MRLASCHSVASSPSRLTQSAVDSPAMDRGVRARAHVPSSDPAAIAKAVAELPGGKHELALVLVAEQAAPDPAALVRHLNRTERTFLGGLFPAVVVAGERHDRGALILGLPM